MPCPGGCKKEDHPEFVGIPYDLSISRTCWLFVNDPQFRTVWGGKPIVRPVESGKQTEDRDFAVAVPEEPGLLRKAVNFTKAAVQHVATGCHSAMPEEKARRLSICELCVGPGGFFDPVSRVCTHPTCGCRMVVKAHWLESKCPIGKW